MAGGEETQGHCATDDLYYVGGVAAVNRLTDLMGLSHNTSLAFLSVKDNAITSLDGIRHLSSLTHIDLDINQVLTG